VAEIVGALGIPHNPFTALAIARGEESVADSLRLYGELREQLRAMAPDTLVIFTTDHYNLFFGLCVPIFAIGVAESTSGPSDYRMLPQLEAAVDMALAAEIQASLVAEGFDVARSQEFELDHTILAPLGVIAPELGFAIVPVWISSSMRPIPSAARCHALCAALARAVAASSLERRVAVAASGAFSFEVGGPLMSEDSHVGVPAPEWTLRVTELLAAGEVAQAVAATTPEQLAAAGNASGGILNWIAMLGAFAPAPPAFIEPQAAEGHAYAAWRLRS
jgi:aromatic ring-opening dioxygenase catalytic subunit (LigB family)